MKNNKQMAVRTINHNKAVMMPKEVIVIGAKKDSLEDFIHRQTIREIDANYQELIK